MDKYQQIRSYANDVSLIFCKCAPVFGCGHASEKACVENKKAEFNKECRTAGKERGEGAEYAINKRFRSQVALILVVVFVVSIVDMLVFGCVEGKISMTCQEMETVYGNDLKRRINRLCRAL
ncbi:hypothetical protein AUEXF2481DRAFT_38610 [Aureobasidium subglaciale EXF-2481]|uniref:Uncharacterized protein n=1 Tax=Aureobasidium subglaciale (strain EXF-2481) TaxID=1043005 RepID=A0A074YEV7_AURSE|nr:uncharacterized protein AUEXF2481DRAFT_38610 [Aureobasidium subglaciale EXF-2481]KEQ96348.1 hypothetical protein AUEXF2481DRAFT_38610 [Aureobasidium subglaciale EXF-2481]